MMILQLADVGCIVGKEVGYKVETNGPHADRMMELCID
jgi:hypothetical protein